MEELRHKAMALADGQLSAHELPDLLAELHRNPVLLQATQDFMALRPNQIARLYARKAEEPVPQRLIDAIMTAPIGAPAPAASNVFSLGSALVNRLRNRYRMPGWSLAAGPAFAALLAVAGAWLLTPSSGLGSTLLATQLQKAIENTKSGATAQLLTFQPNRTFVSKDQRYCRQFEIQSDEERSTAVACRGADGDWRIALELAPFPRTTPVGDRKELEEFLRKNQQGEALDREAVDQLILREWKR